MSAVEASTKTSAGTCDFATVGKGIAQLEQTQQALLSSVELLKKSFGRRNPLRGTSSTPSAKQEMSISTLNNRRTRNDELDSEDDLVDETTSQHSDASIHIKFELVKLGYEIIETFFQETETSLQSPPTSPTSHQVIPNNVSVAVLEKRSFTSPSITSPPHLVETVNSNTVVKVATEKREPKFIHAVNPNGQHVFIVLDLSGTITSAPYDPVLLLTSSKSLPSNVLDECDEFVRATNASIASTVADYVCVYSREAEKQYRRQVLRRACPMQSSESSAQDYVSTRRELNYAQSVRHYPIVRCSVVLSSPDDALDSCDQSTKALVQCGIRLSSKKLNTVRSNLQHVLHKIDAFEQLSDEFLNVTRRSLMFFQSVHDQHHHHNHQQLQSQGQEHEESNPKSHAKVRFNIQKRLEYLTEFSENRNTLFDEAMNSVAFLSGAIEHLMKMTEERGARMQHMLQPLPQNSIREDNNAHVSVPTRALPTTVAREQSQGANASTLTKKSLSALPVPTALAPQQTSSSSGNKLLRVSRSQSSTQSPQVVFDDDDTDELLANQLASAITSMTRSQAATSAIDNVPSSMRKYVMGKKPKG